MVKLILDTDINLFTKIKSKQITNLNVKCTTLDFLEDNIAENVGDLGFGDGFLDTMRKASSIKEKLVS